MDTEIRRETVRLNASTSASSKREALRIALKMLTEAEITADYTSVTVMKHPLVGRRRSSLGPGYWKFRFNKSATVFQDWDLIAIIED